MALRPYAVTLNVPGMLDFAIVLEHEANDPIWCDVMLDMACQREAELNAFVDATKDVDPL